ncbi:hypothetical protein [Sphingomonas sp. Y38-1Y]|uniref:hypothetical protein n=1 Tax=Sphingomonas sp. Y38-1Y TaxID=3078265 RepID=UPI0028E6C867|nr:hypothetical protein [Sphingomonas sp. Y38-1Y]
MLASAFDILDDDRLTEALLRIRPVAAISRTMTASEVQDLLVSTLAKRSGGSLRHWRLVVGSVRLHDAATHPHCNWSVDPSGAAREIGAVEQLLDEVRLTHPIIAAD